MTEPKAGTKPLSAFEKFVRAIAGVPKEELREIEQRKKREPEPKSKARD